MVILHSLTYRHGGTYTKTRTHYILNKERKNRGNLLNVIMTHPHTHMHMHILYSVQCSASFFFRGGACALQRSDTPTMYTRTHTHHEKNLLRKVRSRRDR